jgi:hypothetical protein
MPRVTLESDVLEARIQVAHDELVKSPPPYSGRMRWAESDFRSFDAAIDLDQWLADEGVSYVPFTFRKLENHLIDWRKALPFSEGERARFVEVRRNNPFPASLVPIIRREVGIEQVDDAGIGGNFSGKHVLRDWWNWRRGVGERFEGQQGVERAARSLMLAREIVRRQTL